jgi:hypothetical protein
MSETNPLQDTRTTILKTIKKYVELIYSVQNETELKKSSEILETIQELANVYQTLTYPPPTKA